MSKPVVLFRYHTIDSLWPGDTRQILVNIGSGNGLLPDQAIAWTNVD